MKVGKRNGFRPQPVYINNVLAAARTAGALIVGNAFLGAVQTETWEKPVVVFLIGAMLVLFASITYVDRTTPHEGKE